MSKWIGLGCLGAMVLGAAGAGAEPINLVANGGFEEALPGDNLMPTGWTYTVDGAGGSNSGLAYQEGIDGSNCFAIAPWSSRIDTISQDIPTTPGQAYTLSFWSLSTSGSASFGLLWDGVGVPSGGNYWNMGSDTFGHFTGTVTGGAGTTTTLAFDGNVYDASGAILIDSVSVTAVPEPAGAALVALGGLLLLPRRRRDPLPALRH